jgi:lysozyme
MPPFLVGTYLLSKGHRDDLSPESAPAKPKGQGRGLGPANGPAEPIPLLPVAKPAKAPAAQTREWLEAQLAGKPDTSDRVDGPSPYWRPAPRPLYDAKRSPVDAVLQPDYGAFDRPAPGAAPAPRPTVADQFREAVTAGQTPQGGSGAPAMTPSGIAFLKDWEKTVPKTYTNDGVGVATIGTGHKLTPSERLQYANGLSDPQVAAIFQSDLARKEALVRASVKAPVEKHQFDALVSLGFTSEDAVSRRSTVIRLINAGKFDEAADHFGDWHKGHDRHGDLIDVPGLPKRRSAEKRLFLTGVYDSRH